MASCPAIFDYLSPSILQTLPEHAGKLEVDTILTLTSVIEEISAKRSTLQKHFEAIFE
jgi:hypothetical protein